MAHLRRVHFLLVVALKEEFDYVKKVFPVKRQPQKAGPWTFYMSYLAHNSGRVLSGAVCCIGDMGIDEAQSATGALLQVLRPRIVINLGISGVLDDGLRLGDVVVSTDVQNYFYRSKINQQDPSLPITFDDIEFGGKDIQTTESIYRFVSRLDQEYPLEFRNWQETASDYIHKYLDSHSLEKLQHLQLIADPPRLNIGPCACGPLVVTSRGFKDILKQRNRNFLAVDMESFGVLRAVQITERNISTLVIRGISDLSDERKKEMDSANKGKLRLWAATNAVNLLAEILRKNLLFIPKSLDHLTSRVDLNLMNEAFIEINRMCSAEFLPYHYRDPAQSANLSPNELNALFMPLVRSGVVTNENDFFGDIKKLLDEGGEDFLLQIDGPPGTGKSTFLSLFYWYLYELWLQKKLEFMPIYLNLYRSRTTLRKAWANDSADHIVGIIEDQFAKIRSLTECYPDQPIVFMFDGMDEYIPFKNVITQNLQILIESSKHKKVIAIRDDTDALIFSNRDVKAKRVVKFRPVKVTSKRYVPFVDAFLKLYGRGNSTSLASLISTRVQQFQLQEVDFLTLSLLVRESNPRDQNAYLLSRAVQLYCREQLVRHGQDQKIEQILDKMALLTFQSRMTPGVANIKNEWHISELIERHPLIQDYLVARHVSNELLSIQDRSISEINRLSFAYPFRINRFSKEMLTETENTQKVLANILKRILISDEPSENAKAHACYLAGRLTARQPQETALKVLRELSYKMRKERKERDRDLSRSSRRQGKWHGQKSKPRLLLERSIQISLAYLGDKSEQNYYIDTLLSDPLADGFNRGFHLEYYGDVLYIPNEPLSSIDNLGPCPRTFNHLMTRLQKGPLLNPIFSIELQTLCSLAQHRHAKGYLSQEIRKQITELLSNLRQKKYIRNQKLERYVIMVIDHLSKNNFNPVGVFFDYYKIKSTLRAGWVRRKTNAAESVAAHTYGAYLIGLFFLPESINVERYSKKTILEMLLIHDLAEAITGDYPPDERNEDVERQEREAAFKISLLGTYDEFASLDKQYQLYDEFETRSTYNAEIAYDIDKIENVTQILYFLNTGIPVAGYELWLADLQKEITTEVGLEVLDKILSVFPIPSKE
jgi:5'-deoxynucleotidase YfbR-like HD superfamily hydrolase/nucleoside phosphorylase